MRLLSALLLSSIALTMPFIAYADPDKDDHKRTFTTTMQFEDSDVEDDIVTPLRIYKENEDGITDWTKVLTSELTKRITDDFALSVEGTYVDQSEGAGGENGFAGVGVGFKYGLLEDNIHERKITLGGDFDIGGSGSHNVSPESFSTLSPQLYFAQGIGGLAGRPDWLAPAAITGVIGAEIPTRRFETEFDPSTGTVTRERNQTTAQYGFSLQYDLSYMHQQTKYKVPQFFNHLTPIIEFIFETPLNGDDRATTGTINPGVMWRSDEGIEFGAEALIPINRATGSGVGGTFQFRIPLDQISKSLGYPVF